MKYLDFLAKKWVPITHQNTLKSKKTPEMNELEADKYATQIWAHNFKKAKKLEQFIFVFQKTLIFF